MKKTNIRIEIKAKDLAKKILDKTNGSPPSVYGEEKPTGKNIPDINAKDINRERAELLETSNKKPTYTGLVKEAILELRKAPVKIPDYGYNKEEDWQPFYESQYGSGRGSYTRTETPAMTIDGIDYPESYRYEGEPAPFGFEGGKGSAGRGRYWSPHQPGGRTVGKGLQKQVPPAMTTAPKKPPMATSATGPANVGGVNTGIPIKMSKGSKNKERQVPARKRPRPTSPKEIENMAKSALLKLEKQGPTPDPLYEKEVAERKVGGRGTEYQRVDAKVSNAQRLWDTGREADMPIHSGRYGKWGKDFGPVDYGPAQPGGGEITEERRINPAFSDGSKQGIKPKGPQLSDFPNPKNVLVDDPKRGSGSGSGTFPISEPQRDISTFDYDRKQSTIPSPGLGGKYKPSDKGTKGYPISEPQRDISTFDYDRKLPQQRYMGR